MQTLCLTDLGDTSSEQSTSTLREIKVVYRPGDFVCQQNVMKLIILESTYHFNTNYTIPHCRLYYRSYKTFTCIKLCHSMWIAMLNVDQFSFGVQLYVTLMLLEFCCICNSTLYFLDSMVSGYQHFFGYLRSDSVYTIVVFTSTRISLQNLLLVKLFYRLHNCNEL